MKTSLLQFFSLLVVCFLCSMNGLFAQENVSWLKDFTNEMNVGSGTYKYSFKTVDGNPCKLFIEESKTDKKGTVTTTGYQFYLSDLNPSAMSFKAAGTLASATLETKNSQKFVMVFKNGELDGYTQKVVVNMSEVGNARSFVDIMKSKAEGCQSADKKWSSREDALDWLTKNIGKSATSGTVYEQAFKAGEKGYLVSLEVILGESKGVKQNLLYDFNLSDINANKVSMEVSGKTFHVELPVRENNYYIRMKKGSEVSYVKTLDILSDDLEQARNILNGMVYLVSETQAPQRKAWDNYSAALAFVKGNFAGDYINGESLEFDDSPAGIVKYITSKTDSKGVASKETESFYLTDLQPSVEVVASSKNVTLNLVTRDKNKYIKESNEAATLSYSSLLEIEVNDLEKAREMANALQLAIAKSEKGLVEFSTLDKAIGWMSTNVGEMKFDKETVSQLFVVAPDDENRINLKVTTKGQSSSVVEDYEIYPEDIVKEDVKIKVSGKKLFVELSTGKTKYIKYLKDNVPQNYLSDIEVLFDDVLKAKNFVTAITMLHDKSMVADRSMNDKASAWNYLMANVKKMDSAGVTADQKMEQREGDACKAKLTRVETNSKGASTENVYEFFVSDIDVKYSVISVSSKSLKVSLVTKGKDKLIKPYKNGETGNFIANVDIDVDNVLVAKKMIAAFGTLANLCR
ncbi:MAG TPA: hypothetical protein PLB87_01645 [Prolixibacteraceae bacterium]|nr:hypothetical protein [Prolixibacteraceae bacterium]